MGVCVGGGGQKVGGRVRVRERGGRARSGGIPCSSTPKVVCRGMWEEPRGGCVWCACVCVWGGGEGGVIEDQAGSSAP